MRGKLTPLPSFLRASATDAANMQMRKAGRAKWNRDDWNRMVDFLEGWTEHMFGEGDAGRYRFQVAEQMERAGLLSTRMTAEQMVAAVEAACGFPAAQQQAA